MVRIRGLTSSDVRNSRDGTLSSFTRQSYRSTSTTIAPLDAATTRRHLSLMTGTTSSTTSEPSTKAFPLTINDRGVELKVTPLAHDEDYRTQPKPVYKLPFYGAGDDVINNLSDMDAQRALKCYGGLVAKQDTGDDWRTRLRRATRSWHLPKQLTIRGTVVSNKMLKSVVVAARRPKWHKKLQMPYVRTKRFMAHDELNLCREGDDVVIRSCRPLSKRKTHVVVVNYGDKLAVGKDDRRIDLDKVHEHFNLIEVEGEAHAEDGAVATDSKNESSSVGSAVKLDGEGKVDK